MVTGQKATECIQNNMDIGILSVLRMLGSFGMHDDSRRVKGEDYDYFGARGIQTMFVM